MTSLLLRVATALASEGESNTTSTLTYVAVGVSRARQRSVQADERTRAMEIQERRRPRAGEWLTRPLVANAHCARVHLCSLLPPLVSHTYVRAHTHRPGCHAGSRRRCEQILAQ